MKSISSASILNTKLYKPLVKDYYVVRQRIINVMEKNLHNPLSIIIAGTGYGKSVTVSQWLDRTKSSYCWLSLDDEFNDVHTFFSYLVYTIQSVFPDALKDLKSILQTTEIYPRKMITNLLINELDNLNKQLIIILDDYHKINNSEIHDIINTIIKYPPAKLHLAIISRYDPPLILNQIRSFDNINEIRMSALSFTQDEIKNLVDKILHIRIDEELATYLLQRTEGWIVAIRLALRQMAQSENIKKPIIELKVKEEYFSQYLQEEVLATLEKPIRKLFFIASISDRFSMELLEALAVEDGENPANLDNDTFNQLTIFISVQAIIFMIMILLRSLSDMLRNLETLH